MAKKYDAKAFSQQKRKRRQWLTFVRMIRYGVNNFSRNAWLTIAATAVMTITLLIVFMTLAARNTLATTVDQIRSQVDMSIYLKLDTKQDDINKVINELKGLSTVRAVKYVSPDEQRKDFAEKNSTDAGTLAALNEATNKFPPTIRVNLDDINNTGELSNFVTKNSLMKANINPDRPPSFAGDRKVAIENIGRWVDF